MFPITRMRRLRKNENIRDFFQETYYDVSDLIYPMYVKEDLDGKKPEEISTMPGQFRYSVEDAVTLAGLLEDSGVESVLLFGLPKNKDECGTSGYAKDGVVQKTIQRIKQQTNLIVMADVCMCEYTSHGHCGIIENEYVQNDKTLEYLTKFAISYADSGVDMVAPSDMMDGRVAAIRAGLDANSYEDTPIISYAAKFASSFYAPFREAVDSTPSFGDRKSYQMNPANFNEAIREVELDIQEGADAIIIKPAMPYLDVLYETKKRFKMPTLAYQVSGEYSMLVAGIENGYLTEQSIDESLVSIKRAGADKIITNFASDFIEFE